MYLPDKLTYVKLMALGRRQPPEDARPGRVAVLGFCTTHYYAAVLRGLGKASGFPLATYEPEYNAVFQAVLDDESALYSFRPDFVVVLPAVQALRNVLLATELAARRQVAEREVEQLLSVIRRVAEIPGVTVVVNEFVVPYERAWGNLSGRVETSLISTVRRINQRLRDAADELAGVYSVDTDHIASWIGKQVWFDERLWFHSKNPCHPEALPQLAGQAIDVFRAVQGMGIKCVALDLDNVLWGGTIGDDGLAGIRLGELGEGEAYVQFQRWLGELRARGILLAVCSKNDPERAREPFRHHSDMVLAEADVSCFIANWDNKAANLRVLARRLNIGLDSVVFIDDSPFERNLVRELVPEVCVPELPEDPADYVPYLESLNLFEALQFSDEDRVRPDLYRANALRDEEQVKFTDVTQYLVSLEMEATFERFDDLHLPRITQLVQRTNQFNLTTKRHSGEELAAFAEDPDCFAFYVTLMDRFGENGLISVVIGRRSNGDLDIVTWLMSCRVIARRLEEFVLDELVEVARDAGIGRLRGLYIPSAKNELVARHYERLGFELTEELPDGSSTWQLEVAGYVPSGAPIARRSLQLDS